MLMKDGIPSNVGNYEVEVKSDFHTESSDDEKRIMIIETISEEHEDEDDQ